MKQMKLRMEALANTFKHANANNTENKREIRAMELKDSIIFDELYNGVSAEMLDNIKKFEMFDNSFSFKITRNDERGNAELPDIYTKTQITEIKKQYNLIEYNIVKDDINILYNSLTNPHFKEIVDSLNEKEKLISILRFGNKDGFFLGMNDIINFLKISEEEFRNVSKKVLEMYKVNINKKIEFIHNQIMISCLEDKNNKKEDINISSEILKKIYNSINIPYLKEIINLLYEKDETSKVVSILKFGNKDGMIFSVEDISNIMKISKEEIQAICKKTINEYKYYLNQFLDIELIFAEGKADDGTFQIRDRLQKELTKKRLLF